MQLRILSLIGIFALFIGCGKSKDSTDKSVVDFGSTKPSMTTDSAPGNAATPPPGTIEMPPGVDASSIPPVAPPRDENDKSGGIEMPPIGSDAPPVIAKRPVLDEVKPALEIKLTAATLDSIQQAVAKTGQICVVDFWSLSCEPCLKEFPGLVRLNENLAGKLVCISVNLDYDGRKSKPAEKYRSRVESFLQSTGAKFDNFLCETPSEEVYAALKIVSIPAVLVYDAKGKLVRTFTDTGDDAGFSYASDIVPLVQSLISQ